MTARKPPYLLRVAAKNYRSLQDVDVRLGPLSVLVGPNGAGKSTLLDVLAFLGEAAQRDLRPVLESRGGLERLEFRGGGPAGPWLRAGNEPWVEISIEAAVTRHSSSKATDDYTLRFRNQSVRGRPGEKALHCEEKFVFEGARGRSLQVDLHDSALEVALDGTVERSLTLTPGSLALTTLPRLGPADGGKEVEAIARLFESSRVFDVDVAKVRRPDPVGVVSHRLRDDASNLGVYLQYLAADHEEVFEQVQHDARHFVPGLEEIVFRPTSGAVEGVVTQIVERGLAGSTDLGEVSFGSIRALALLALLHDPRPAKITCLEEVDHGLHPYVLDRLVDLLREASARTQLIVATHSPALVNRLSADELIVCERDASGASRIPAIPAADVRAMEEALHGELALGELWFTGALGGVPQA